jgi:hypothetical protein
MAARTGTARLPLHGGKAPAWLFRLMKPLAREITLAVVEDAGPAEMLRKLADPFWFQAFGCVLGFDWHSSGSTTVACGALKEGLAGIEREVGLFVAGGKGRTSRKTPDEIRALETALDVDPAGLVYASKLAAKVDNTAVQDGYQLYHHTFVFTPAGEWCVVQQGMSDASGYARRYHWLSEEVADFVNEPHAAVCAADSGGPVLNLVAAESSAARARSAVLAAEKPEVVMNELRLAAHHDVRLTDINPDRLRSVFESTYQQPPAGFEALLATPGVGPTSIRALALLSELLYGDRPSFRDPARFSFAHGGKDGHPYPVDRTTYAATIDTLRTALGRARLGQTERLAALKRLARVEKRPPITEAPAA